MFIKKIEKDKIKKFVFVLRNSDGSEYQKTVFATNENEAQQRLRNIIIKSRDDIGRLKRSSSAQ